MLAKWRKRKQWTRPLKWRSNGTVALAPVAEGENEFSISVEILHIAATTFDRTGVVK